MGKWPEHVAVFKKKSSILYAGHWDRDIYLCLSSFFPPCIQNPYIEANIIC